MVDRLSIGSLFEFLFSSSLANELGNAVTHFLEHSTFSVRMNKQLICKQYANEKINHRKSLNFYSRDHVFLLLNFVYLVFLWSV